jgi:hypothetical protein
MHLLKNDYDFNLLDRVQIFDFNDVLVICIQCDFIDCCLVAKSLKYNF